MKWWYACYIVFFPPILQSPGEKEGCFLMRRKGRKGAGRPRYVEDLNGVFTLDAF